MTTNLQPTTDDKTEKSIDLLAREYYRQLSIAGIQAAVYAAGVPDETLEYYCNIYAREMATQQLRSELHNQIVRRVHDAARVSCGRTVVEFAQCLIKAVNICNRQQEEIA